MSTITIRKLDDEVKLALRRRAADHGVSMEEEVRRILAAFVLGEQSKRRRPSIDAMRKLGRKPDAPFDLKKLRDEMWDEGLR